MKTCTICKTPKPLSEFTKDKNGKDGLKSGCRPCLTKQKKESRHRNPEASRRAVKKWRSENVEKCLESSRKYRQSLPIEIKRARYNKWAEANPDKISFYSHKAKLKNHYNMTPEEYAKRLLIQGGGCALCGGRPDRTLAVDHCHASGKVRGLLCRACNTGLGFFKDCIPLLERAIAYLKEGDA